VGSGKQCCTAAKSKEYSMDAKKKAQKKIALGKATYKSEKPVPISKIILSS